MTLPENVFNDCCTSGFEFSFQVNDADCGGCPDGTIARCWEFTIAGVTNQQSCGTCSVVNGTKTVEFSEIDGSNRCVFLSDTFQFDFYVPLFDTCSELTFRWRLAVYPDASFEVAMIRDGFTNYVENSRYLTATGGTPEAGDCEGSNTLEHQPVANPSVTACQNWPSTITLTPC